MMKIAFIGGGNMGEAMLSAMIRREIARAADITVSDISGERRKYLSEKYQITATGDNAGAVGKADVIILAVKPQSLGAVLPGLKGRLAANQLVISIIAGATVAKLQNGLNHDCLIRTMPNTPAQIGEGVTVWIATPGVSATMKTTAKKILDVMGKEIEVSEEDYLNMATAVSGSGPAYVFLFMEALEKAARDIGLPADTARELTFRTVLGSARYAELSGRALPDLRQAVTSPGGTTAEALAVLAKGNFVGLLGEAVTAACDKSRILGKQ
jgi:pyrroline-5-carboxylate reductase